MRNLERHRPGTAYELPLDTTNWPVILDDAEVKDLVEAIQEFQSEKIEAAKDDWFEGKTIEIRF